MAVMHEHIPENKHYMHVSLSFRIHEDESVTKKMCTHSRYALYVIFDEYCRNCEKKLSPSLPMSALDCGPRGQGSILIKIIILCGLEKVTFPQLL